MESEAFHIPNAHVEYSPVEAPIASRGDGARAQPAPPPTQRKAPARLGLQQRAESNLRLHFVRALRRFVVLVIADLASFCVMRALVRAVRDQALFGSWVSSQLSNLLPWGILNGWLVRRDAQ